MKLRAKTAASVSLQLGPVIEPGHDADFGDGADVPEVLRCEIADNVKRGLLEIVLDDASAETTDASKQATKKKGGR
jgi:hypothetical protein